MKNHKDSLSGIAISENIEKAASCGDNTVKIHELHDLKDTANVITLDDERGLDQMEWSEDGQLLAVSTTKGKVKLPFFLVMAFMLSAILSSYKTTNSPNAYIIFR